MIQNGITQSLEQSEILDRDHGIKILPHLLAEHKYHEKKAAFYGRAKGSESE
jgi:hypothetical protein